ncbi:MAG: DUF4134 family protein, partial [Bacteroidales bacterium]
MKKNILILSVMLLAGGMLRGQAVVSDPVHTAATIAGFLSSLEEAILTTANLGKQLDEHKKQVEFLQGAKALTSDINRMLTQAQEIYIAGETLVEMGKNIESSYKAVTSSGQFSIAECRDVLDWYTATLQRGERNVRVITDYLSKDKWRMTDYERLQELRRNTEEMQKLNDSILNMNQRLRQEEVKRKMREELRKRNVISPIENFWSARQLTALEGFTWGMELQYALSSLDVESEIEKSDTNTAVNEIVKQMKTYANIFYAISALIGLIGALRVWRKVQNGEDIGKTIGVW